MSIEGAILIWLAIGAGIAAGVFVVARSAVQLGSVAYRVMEKQLSRQAATRETMLLFVPCTIRGAPFTSCTGRNFPEVALPAAVSVMWKIPLWPSTPPCGTLLGCSTAPLVL